MAGLTVSPGVAVHVRALKEVASVTSLKVALTFLGAGLQLLIARILGPEEFGKYASVIAFVSPLAAVSTVGFQQTVLRFSSLLRANGHRRGIIDLMMVATVATCSAGLIFAALIVLVGTYRGPTRDLSALLIGSTLIPLGGLSLLLGSLLRAVELPLAAMLPEPLCRSIGLALVLAGWAGGLLHLDSMYVLLATVSSLLVAVSWSSWRARTAISAIPQRTGNSVFNTELVRATGYAFLLLIANVIATRTIAALLASVLPPQEFAAYAVATRLADLLAVPTWGATLLVAPRFASLSAGEAPYLVTDLLRQSRRTATVLSTIPILLTLGFAEPLLGVVGPSYTAAAPVLRILALKVLILALIGPTLAVLTMCGAERTAALLMTVFGVLAVASTSILAVHWGGIGGALGQSAVEIAVAVSCLHLLTRRFSRWPKAVQQASGEIR